MTDQVDKAGNVNDAARARRSGATRRRGPRRRRLVWIFFLIAMLAGLPIAAQLRFSWPEAVSAFDEAVLRFERGWRRHYASFNATLPGTPDLASLDARLAAKGFTLGDPLLIRIFKREFELEVWMRSGERYRLFETYPICRFSGDLGPKLKEGDRQSPEGFYTVSKTQLNPASRWHRSFNLGFPNVHDRAHGRTGSFLMVHGGCSSIGCYAMTDAVIDEIWRLVTASLAGKQRRFQVQAYPFRMTEANLAQRAENAWAPFWRDLKAGHDLFETTGLPPRVQVCNGRYTFAKGLAGAASASPVVSGCAVAGTVAGAGLAGAGLVGAAEPLEEGVPIPTRRALR